MLDEPDADDITATKLPPPTKAVASDGMTAKTPPPGGGKAGERDEDTEQCDAAHEPRPREQPRERAEQAGDHRHGGE